MKFKNIIFVSTFILFLFGSTELASIQAKTMTMEQLQAYRPVKNGEMVFVSGSSILGQEVAGDFVWNSTVDKSKANLGTGLDPASSIDQQGKGIGSGVWIRKFTGPANLKWWGGNISNKDNAENFTNALKRSKNFTGVMQLDPGHYYLNNLETMNLNYKHLIGNGATIFFNKSLKGNGLVFNQLTRLYDMTFDGQDNSFRPFMVAIHSDAVAIKNVHFKNILGTPESSSLYALSLDWNTRFSIISSTFKNIRSYTNPQATAGFVGGLFISDLYEKINGIALKKSSHIIVDSQFEDIYTLKNLEGKFFADSDGIRNYIYKSSLSEEEKANIKETVISVRRTKFKNVLKSGLKLNYAKMKVKGLQFEVDDLKDQGLGCSGRVANSGCGNAYTAIRYQNGNGDVEIEGVKTKGPIRFGAVILSEGVSVIKNFNFDSSYASPNLMIVGTDRTKKIKSSDVRVYNSKITRGGVGVVRKVQNLVLDNVSNIGDVAFLVVPYDLNTWGYTVDNFTIRKTCKISGVMKSYSSDVAKIHKLTSTSSVAIDPSVSVQE